VGGNRALNTFIGNSREKKRIEGVLTEDNVNIGKWKKVPCFYQQCAESLAYGIIIRVVV